MGTSAIDSRISRLPKWAQTYIAGLLRKIHAKNRLISSLRKKDKKPKHHDHRFYVDYMDRDTGSDRRYIEANAISLHNCGVKLTILPREEGISLLFDNDYEFGHQGDVSIVPRAGNHIHLVLSEHKKIKRRRRGLRDRSKDSA